MSGLQCRLTCPLCRQLLIAPLTDVYYTGSYVLKQLLTFYHQSCVYNNKWAKNWVCELSLCIKLQNLTRLKNDELNIIRVYIPQTLDAIKVTWSQRMSFVEYSRS